MKLVFLIIAILINFFNQSSLKSEEKINSGNNKIENIAKKESINGDKTEIRKIHIVRRGDTISSISKIYSIDKDLIKNVKVFDVYEGENIPKEKKSIALNVTVQSSEKTLNEKDLEKINNLIISTVESKSGAKIRS